MEDKVLEILTNEDGALEISAIEEKLGFSTVDELKELLKVLETLENENKIYKTKKDKYMLFDKSNLKIGKLLGTKKGYAFVDIEGDEDVFVSQNNLNGAIDSDTVVVEVTSKKGLKLEGRIVKVVERKIQQLVGKVYFKNNKCLIDLDDKKVSIDIVIDEDKTLNAVSGHKVVVRLLGKLDSETYRGAIIKILGHVDDPGVDILSIAAKYEIEDEFPEEVEEQLKNIPDHVLESEYENRTDLRDQVIFTIDGDDTKDIDDAISIEKLSNGNYKLGVHIADVSYYVTENSPLDSEAYKRGTSVYLANTVIPMLPHQLSNGICSLNPNVDRLAISCVMEIDLSGEIVEYDIFESVIKSNIQMTYKNVNSILEENIVPEGYEIYVDSLKQMQELAEILRKNKIRKGYIDFNIDEAKIITDDKGEAIDVKLRERGTGEKLIEDFMIAANETVANHITYMEYPFIYRVHGEPNEEKINNFLNFVSILGYNVKKMSKITPKSMQELLNELSDKKEYPILSSLLLRSMQKAVYDRNNIGHFGLASKCYTHFTSPIRRYPDTTVHRLLRTYLFNKNLSKDTIDYWDKKLVVVSAHTSERERASIECEREVDDMKMAEYMEKHIGEEFSGIVSGVVSFGLFIELPNKIEGLIRIDDLTDDYYTYDETTFSLIGRKNKRGYRLGDDVKVVVKAANKLNHTIDFILKK
ncbi:MAG: ribonuclease R [bacterium]|nr:ribonuclease R [bacterium]